MLWRPKVSNVLKLHNTDQRAEQASVWIATLDRDLTSVEKDEIRAWISQDPRNKTTLSEMAGIWDDMDALSRLSKLFPNPASGKSHRQNRRYMGMAAGVALLAAVLVSAFFATDSYKDTADRHQAIQTAMLQTAIGDLSTVQLVDGSQITLNTNSRVEIEFGENQRNIRLLKGEIHIDVSHDPSRHLNVFVGDRVFQDDGAAFTVKIDVNQRVELLVTDGIVKVGIAPVLIASADQELNGISVSKGQRMMLDDSNEQLERLEPEEMEVQLSWREGNLIFTGESLGDAAAEISRYTPIEFVFLDDDLQKIRVAGLFKAGDITGFLSSLNANFEIVHHQINEQTIQLNSATVAARSE